MNDWIESFSFTLAGAALLLSVMGLWFTAIFSEFDRWSKRFFLSYFIIFMFVCLSGIMEVILQNDTVPRWVFILLLFLESLLLTVPLPMQTAYLLHCCGEDLRSSPLFHAVLALYAILFLALVSASFLEGFFYLTPENQYHRGPLYQLILLPLIAIQLLTFAGVIKRRKRLSRKVFFAFLIAILPIAVAVTVLLFVDFLPLFGFSHVLSALAVYSLILSDQIEQDRRRQQEIIRQQQKIARQQQEIAQERASVMVLQMRPHFIYNTLVSIHSLCRLDPRKAQQVTLDFTNYLRRNFSAVSSDKNISFSTELEHTRAYLAVEQALHDDMLLVDYDTPFTNFRLPPLTLQPIVENAVKHGMNSYPEPLRISIRTRHTDAGVEIIVENNGADFAPVDDNGSNSALQNIQQRLEMCGGSISIKPRDDGGTMVKLMIPSA